MMIVYMYVTFVHQVLDYSLLSQQKGDSAVIQATVEHQSGALQVLVSAGADLNLQNQVRYTVTVDCNVPCIIPY